MVTLNFVLKGLNHTSLEKSSNEYYSDSLIAMKSSLRDEPKKFAYFLRPNKIRD